MNFLIFAPLPELLVCHRVLLLYIIMAIFQLGNGGLHLTTYLTFQISILSKLKVGEVSSSILFVFE